MSLSRFLDIKDVNDKIKCLRPKGSRKISVPLRIGPRSDRYTMVGTAFDYLLRFEMQRRSRRAVATSWVAETAAELIFRDDGNMSVGLDIFRGAPPQDYLPPEVIARRAKGIVQKAKVAVAAFCRSSAPDNAMLKELAEHAIRLAKLDSIQRARFSDPRFETANEEDVEDLVAMLSIVPFDDLLSEDTLLLNPTFGNSSREVGGADTDLISGDRLIDFKVTKNVSMEPKWLDQLLGYFLLWCRERRKAPALPEIRKAGFLFARHGYLWTFDVTDWAEHPEFPVIEKWFFKRAKELRSTQPGRSHR